MIVALAKAGADGISGGEINKAILDRDLSVADADNAKARLKSALSRFRKGVGGSPPSSSVRERVDAPI